MLTLIFLPLYNSSTLQGICFIIALNIFLCFLFSINFVDKFFSTSFCDVSEKLPVELQDSASSILNNMLFFNNCIGILFCIFLIFFWEVPEAVEFFSSVTRKLGVWARKHAPVLSEKCTQCIKTLEDYESSRIRNYFAFLLYFILVTWTVRVSNFFATGLLILVGLTGLIVGLLVFSLTHFIKVKPTKDNGIKLKSKLSVSEVFQIRLYRHTYRSLSKPVSPGELGQRGILSKLRVLMKKRKKAQIPLIFWCSILFIVSIFFKILFALSLINLDDYLNGWLGIKLVGGLIYARQCITDLYLFETIFRDDLSLHCGGKEKAAEAAALLMAARIAAFIQLGGAAAGGTYISSLTTKIDGLEHRNNELEGSLGLQTRRADDLQRQIDMADVNSKIDKSARETQSLIMHEKFAQIMREIDSKESKKK